MGDLKNPSRGGEAGVVDYAPALRDQGYDTELFAGPQVKQEWFDGIDALREEFDMEILPDDIIYETTFYKKNIACAQKLKDEGYTVVDIGNPNGKVDLGPFYSGELDTVFGSSSAESIINLTDVNKY